MTASHAQTSSSAGDLDKIARKDLFHATPADAQRLLMDLTAMPWSSRIPEPVEPENTRWLKAVLKQRPRSGRFPVPSEAIGPRILALVERGADPIAGKSLHRAVHRRDLAQVQALLDLPEPPPPSQASSSGATALHRAAYAGGDDIFKLLAAKAKPEDWARQDKDGRTPLEKAFMSRRLGRAALAAAHSTPNLDPNPQGQTFFHRFALFMNEIPEEDQSKWIPVFTELLAKSSEKHLAALNAAGQTPLTLLAESGLHASLLERAILLLNAPQAQPPASAKTPKARL